MSRKKRAKSAKYLVQAAGIEPATTTMSRKRPADRPAFARALETLKPGQSCEIPQGLEVIPLLDERGDNTTGRWVLTAVARKSGKNPVNGARAKRRSA